MPKLRVVVHPLGTGAYWVQPIPSYGKDGHWSTVAYFGRSGDVDIGKAFEVMAIGDPEEALDEGAVLDAWPKAAQRSLVVQVTRN